MRQLLLYWTIWWQFALKTSVRFVYCVIWLSIYNIIRKLFAFIETDCIKMHKTSYWSSKNRVKSDKCKKLFKNLLTNRLKSGRISKFAWENKISHHEKSFKKTKKLFKNLLTNGWGCDIITKLPPKRQRSQLKLEKRLKKIKKVFKNLLTKRKGCDIIDRLSQREREKIEPWQLNNRRYKYKAKLS